MSHTSKPSPSHQQLAQKQQYLRTRVMTATPEQLQLMLYDGAIRFTEAARDALGRRDLEAVHTNVTRGPSDRDRAAERPAAGPHGAEVCSRLAGLYRHVFRQLIDVGFHHTERAADEALTVLRHQRATWAMLLEQVGREKAAGRVRGQAYAPAVSMGLSIAA